MKTAKAKGSKKKKNSKNAVPKKKVLGYQIIDAKRIVEPKIAARFVVDSESVHDLTESIRKIGLIQPLVVKQKGEKFEVVVGHRRLIASRLARLTELKCIVIEKDADVEEVVKLHENIMRQDLSPVEEAIYIHYLIEKRKKSQKEIAEMLNVSEGYISQRLSMLNWHEKLIEAVDAGLISFTSARELARITDEGALLMHVQQAVEHGVTPRVANMWFRDWLSSKDYDLHGHTEKEDEIVEVDTDTTQFNCGMCGETYSYKELIYMRLCRDCYNATVTVKREMLKEERNRESS
ncbi:MAG: ParB/RepB/Spo0J family partition protein [Candidatus Krumholzibacteria bacterium]|nr:ParB/RepB/Spo0J family partition protein [Candidatus Krumholzibacteria bacterium]